MAWETEHAVLTGGGIKVPRETDAQRLRRVALSWGRCLCRQHGRTHFQMAKQLSSAIFRWVFDGGPRRRRGAAPPTVARRRQLLEEARAVMQIQAVVSPETGISDVVWALVVYTTFESGAQPSLLRLRPRRASSQVAIGCSQPPVLECLVTGGMAPWCSFADVVEQCDPALAWTLQRWAASSFTDLAVTISHASETSDTELPWWRGNADVEKVKKASEFPLSDSEEGEEPWQEQKSPADHSDVSDGFVEAEDGLPAVDEIASSAKHHRRGQRFDCLASHRAGRFALSFLLTYKAGSDKKRPQFQITCDHHEPDVLLNKRGSQYRLPCRRTATVMGDTAEHERSTLRHLLSWVRAGPCADSRLVHQNMRDEDFASSEGEDCHEEDGEERGTVAGDCTSPPVLSSDRASSPVATGRAASRATDSSTGLPDANAVVPSSCWLCDGNHTEADCEQYRALFLGSGPMPMTKNSAALRPVGRVAQPSGALLLETREVGTKDVPTDGACLFHSLALELKHALRGHPVVERDAQGWREMVTAYVLSTRDCMGGTSVQDWVTLVTGASVSDYVETMSRPTTSGGFLEVALICNIAAAESRAELSVVILLDCGPRGFQTLSSVGSTAPDSRLACIAWQGAHWVRARLHPAGVARVREWLGRG